MQRLFLVLTILVCTMPLTACTQMAAFEEEEIPVQEVALEEVSAPASLGSFSYAEDADIYQPGEAGVNPAAFANTDACPIADQAPAVTRAKNECTIDYTTTSVYLDSEAGMWRVDFLNLIRDEQGVLTVSDDWQKVYLGSDGITTLIVYPASQSVCEIEASPDQMTSPLELDDISATTSTIENTVTEIGRGDFCRSVELSINDAGAIKEIIGRQTATDFVTPEEIFMIPSLTTVDISAYYTKGTPFFDESRPKYSLPCQYIADNTYAESEMSYSLPIEQFSTMNFQCTWTRLGNTVYIGFLNAATDVAYVIPCVSGTASGSVELNCLPDGDYKVILYSNRNFSTTAVLNYQFS